MAFTVVYGTDRFGSGVSNGLPQYCYRHVGIDTFGDSATVKRVKKGGDSVFFSSEVFDATAWTTILLLTVSVGLAQESCPSQNKLTDQEQFIRPEIKSRINETIETDEVKDLAAKMRYMTANVRMGLSYVGSKLRRGSKQRRSPSTNERNG
jgi:hypothetical protein